MAWEDSLSPKDFAESDQRKEVRKLQKKALVGLVKHPELREELISLLDAETGFEDQAKFTTEEAKKEVVIAELRKIQRRIDEILFADIERESDEQIKEELRRDEEDLKKKIWG